MDATQDRLESLEQRHEQTEARDDRQDFDIAQLKRVVFGQNMLSAVIGSLPATLIISIPLLLKHCGG